MLRKTVQLNHPQYVPRVSRVSYLPVVPSHVVVAGLRHVETLVGGGTAPCQAMQVATYPLATENEKTRTTILRAGGELVNLQADPDT